MIIENLSRTSPIHILCVKVNGADMEYVHEKNTVLQVGEKYVIDITDISLESAEKPFTVAVTCLIDNTMHTFAVKEFDFIAMSDENMEIYSHLAKNNDVEDAEPAPEETITEVPETTEPETEEKKYIKLYFSDLKSEKLIAEAREITVSQKETMEMRVLKELVKGPVNPKLMKTIKSYMPSAVSAIPNVSRKLRIILRRNICRSL